MSIFICWSGPFSEKLAGAVKGLLLKTLTTLGKDDIFISGQIEKGVEWFSSLVQCIENSEVGIVCLTAENLKSPWLHFESGALALRLAQNPTTKGRPDSPPLEEATTSRYRLFTLLHKVPAGQLEWPLGAFQSTSTTQSDMAAMIRSIATILGEEHLKGIQDRESVIQQADWAAFEIQLQKLSVPARELIDGFGSIFQRKTFNEPVHRCADQAWLRRHDGARIAREQLAVHLQQVRAVCPTHESDLFEMLLAELDGYSMAIQALLLQPEKFTLGVRGELEMDPGIRKCCEDRRLAIKSLSGLLLRSPDTPLADEAIRFMGAETNEERKMIVHRLEGRIRPERELAFEAEAKQPGTGAAWPALNNLTGGLKPIKFRESCWDLDRIYYYLLVQYFCNGALRWEPVGSSHSAPPHSDSQPVWLQQDWLCAARDVEMEVERYSAKSKGGSLMPLSYALYVLQELNKHTPPDPREARDRVRLAVESAQRELGEEVLTSDEGRSIAWLLKQLLLNTEPEKPALDSLPAKA